jgi:predicted metallopeptidase
MTNPLQLPLPLFEGEPVGFDITSQLERLIIDITRSCPRFAHIDPSRLVVSCVTTRSRSRHGKYASIFPLRFEGGSDKQVTRRTTWHLPHILIDGRDALYSLFFYIPRFLGLDATRRLTVVFHELFHINDKFDGDLRRFPGCFSYHGKSVRQFEEAFKPDVESYIASGRPRRFETLLEYPISKMLRRYGAISFRRSRQPRLSRRHEVWTIRERERTGTIEAPSAARHRLAAAI